MVSVGAFGGVWTHWGPWSEQRRKFLFLSGNIIKSLDQGKVKELCKVKSSANTHHTGHKVCPGLSMHAIILI